MKKALLLYLLLLTAGNVYAQFDTLLIAATGDMYPLILAQTGDIDSDGDIDILAKRNSDHDVYWYPNEGNGKFGKEIFVFDLYQLGNTGVYHEFFAEIVDIDKSGRNDIVCFSNGANIPLIFREGYGFSPIKIPLSINEELGDFKVVDIDNDNDLDIILFFRYASVLWLENTGDIYNWNSHEISNIDNSASGQIIDLNEDGYLDILKTSYSGFGHDIFFNDRNGSFYKSEIENDRFGYPIILHAEDIENDGDMDVIGGLDQFEGNLVMFKNNSGHFTREIIENTNYRFESIVFNDFDLDGDVDLIGGCWMSCGVTLYENNGGKFTRRIIANSSGISLRVLKVADIDNDKKPDIVFSNEGNRKIFWMKNKSKTPTVDEFVPASGKPGTVVTLKGAYFDKINSIKLNNISIPFDFISPEELTFVVPRKAASGVITIEFPGGGSFETKEEIVVIHQLESPIELRTMQSDSSVILSWTDNSSEEDGFVIERSYNSDSGVVFLSIDTVASDINEYEDKDILKFESYQYKVYAFNSFVKSSYSNTSLEAYLIDVEVCASLSPKLSDFGNVCVAEGSFKLTQGTPAGGIYSGNGVYNGTFDPSLAGVGTHAISYNIVTSVKGCQSSITRSITVIESPTVTLLPFGDICLDSPPLTLTGGYPAGGIYSGKGVYNGTFNPSLAGAGTHFIKYDIITSAKGCLNSITKSITVKEGPAVTLLPFEDICLDSPLLMLTGGYPGGGIYLGKGVNNGIFNVREAGLGQHSIQYVVNSSNCADTISQEINVTICTGLQENALREAISVYPNPAQEYLFVDYQDLTSSTIEAFLFSSTGVKLRERQLKKDGQKVVLFTLTGLSAGAYLVKVTDGKSEIWKLVFKE